MARRVVPRLRLSELSCEGGHVCTSCIPLLGMEENLPFPIMLFIVHGQNLMTGEGSSYEQEDDQETKARPAS